jgi:hypothetical protein
LDVQQIAQAFQYSGLQAFGLTMPRLAIDWSPDGATNPSFTVSDGSGSTPIMTITSSANWAAPFEAPYLDVITGIPFPVTLVMADGSAETAPGVLLTVPDQQWVRLGRLYCEILQTSDSTRPERERGLSCRPVPRYVYFPGQSISTGSPPGVATSGLAEAGADLGFSGDARFYDGDGLLIDPVAVMAAFVALLTRYPGLQATALGAEPATTIPLSNYLTGGDSPLASSTVTRIRLVNADGGPYAPATLFLTGLTQVDQNSALYELSGSPLSIGLMDVDSASFTQFQHDRIVFGSASNGRLTSSFTPPELPTASPEVTLARDYYTIRVIELQPYLNGRWPTDSPSDPALSVQRYAPVRINENISFLLTGNDVLGAIHTALDAGFPPQSSVSSPPETDLALVVAQALDGNFPIPSAPGAAAQWPSFPPGLSVNPSATLSINLSTQVSLTAGWVTTAANTAVTGDVDLEITNLPASAWVRVYPRTFLPNATSARGDGQGREVPASGIVVMTLKDPLSVRDPLTGFSYIPKSATLQFDLSVMLPNGQTRIYGGLTVGIGTSPISSPPFAPDTGTNPCGFAEYQGVSNAGILGLGHVGPISPPPTSLLGWVKALTGEGTPRDAPRLPTMARRELLVAGAGTDATSGSPAFARTWSGVIAGGRIQPETVSASSRIGAPGSFGGRETSVVGAATHGGLLAYDIGRHALRRSQDIITRLVTLASSKWNSPSEPTPVDVGKTAGADNGTLAGALLQTVAPYCESPELDELWDIPVVSNAVTTWITQANLANSSQVIQALQSLESVAPAPQPVVESTPGSGTLGQFEAPVQRLALELERELTSGRYGRRDAQWALQSALQNARHFIYIETPGFCSTAHASGSPMPGLQIYAADLIETLKARLTSMPGLRAVICVNRNPDFAPGYEGMASYEVQDRLAIVQSMPSTGSPPTSPPSSSQFALLHPIGFPGRYARVETNVVIIDDIWAMIGGCTLRRRGLTFDGSSDLAFTDTLIENGRSTAIRDFRRTLIANRLGVSADSTQSTYVALAEAATAFSVIQDALNGGGAGKISPVWDGTTPGITPATPLTADEANPDGRNFDEVTAAVVSLLGSASGV